MLVYNTIEKTTQKPLYLSESVTNSLLPRSLLLSSVSSPDLEQHVNTLAARAPTPINLKEEFAALTWMMACAAGKNVSKQDGEFFYKRQYGYTQDRQLSRFLNEFGQLPSQVWKNKRIVKAFVTKDFIKTWIDISKLKVKNTIGLIVTDMELHRLPRNIVRLKNIEELNLSGNKFTTMPAQIGCFTRLTILNLSNNKITKLSSEIEKLKRLKELYLNNNKLSSLPPEIGLLMRLKFLDVSHNKLKSLPNEMGSLMHLKSLILRNNKLDSLPKGLACLVNLKNLNLSKNQFCSLPIQMVFLVNLIILNLSENKFKSLPADIGALHKLKELDLSHNQFEKILIENLKPCKNLRQLNLTANPIVGTSQAREALKKQLPKKYDLIWR